MLAMIESFERLLKELAAVCINQVIPYVIDERLSKSRLAPRGLVAHLVSGVPDIGKAFAESETWFNTSEINDRFAGLLFIDSQPDSRFSLFPAQRSDPEYWRRENLEILWQLRHTITHNVGVITQSDAFKLSLLCRKRINAPVVFTPRNGDAHKTKRFLDSLAAWTNQRIAERLAAVLEDIHRGNPDLFDHSQKEAELAAIMDLPVRLKPARASSATRRQPGRGPPSRAAKPQPS